jgi:GH15 family glucan-1,4-alpha-glucosidase
MTRPGANVRGIPGNQKFSPRVGFPDTEGNHEYTLGADVLATQYAAYVAYAHFQDILGKAETARTYLKKAADVRSLVNNTWWNEKEQYFYSRVGKDHKLEGRGGGNLAYWGIVDDGPKLKSAMNEADRATSESFTVMAT